MLELNSLFTRSDAGLKVKALFALFEIALAPPQELDVFGHTHAPKSR